MLTYPRPDTILIYAGMHFTAEWYYTEAGELPGAAYYGQLVENDRRAFLHLVTHFCDTRPGTLLPKTMYRIEDRDNKIYAFKPRSERFFNFTTVGSKVIITNAYHKHSQQMTKQDDEQLCTAGRYRQDYLLRVRGNTYYEK